ncbi:MAG: hypothetical protein HOP11_03830 [Saprospiraceae bacterium]|nr:hypothetical protein [Saprospiraceae bacterium]
MNNSLKGILLITKTFIFFSVMVVLFPTCKKDDKSKEFVLRIRLADEPDCLHPVISQHGLATQLESLIMPPLFEYDVVSLDPLSILLENLSQPEEVNDSTYVYNYRIHKEAVWDDGRPVVSSDILFTLKSSLNPFIKNKTYAGFFKNIRDAKVDETDPKSIQIFVNKSYMLHREMSGNYCIYPEHIYDSKSILKGFSLQDLLTKDSASLGAEKWNQLKLYAEEYQSNDFCRNKITGCGPYKLASWQSGSKIILEKKKSWWGDSLSKNYPLLTAKPDRIEYWILPDETSALLELEKGNIDIMSDITPRNYVDLQKKGNSQLQFATPSILQYNFVEINHRRASLSEENVRKALCHLIDIQKFIQEHYYNLAVSVKSPVHPSRNYFNSELQDYDFNPGKSISILKESGWKDSDNDGTLDKVIKNKKEKLAFQLLVTNRELSKKFALLFQEEAKKVGITIDIVTKETTAFMSELNSLNFDLAMSGARQSPSPWDPYQAWSSKNTNSGGFNKSGYSSSFVDSLIFAIRTASNESNRTTAYKLLQKDLHEHVAQIFLFAPKERIAYNKRLNIETGSRRPGYYEGMVKLK